MATVDQFSDPAFGVLFHQVKRMPGLEGFVKQAAVEPDEVRSLPDTAFAWPAERKFPIHTPEHAALSFAYSKVASVLPVEVRTNIQKALDVYDVPKDIFKEEETKVAADDSADYLVPSLKLFQVKTAEQCKRAQDTLVSALSRLDLETRATACGNLVKKADELKVELRPEVLQLAGLVVSSTKTAMDWLEARADKLSPSDEVHKNAYLSLAHAMKGPAEHGDRKGLLKVAAAIAELDEKTGLDKHYDRKLPDALRTVFNTEKVASQSIDLGGTFVPFKKIAALPASFWLDLGGKELSDEIAPGGTVDQSKLATVVETLPLDLKLVLKGYCR